jgi:hypothetical protein
MIDNGAGVQIPTYEDFPNAINPSFRQEPPAGHENDLLIHPNICADGSPRPCPEAISADDVGTYVVNYRNEPIGLRVYDPATKATCPTRSSHGPTARSPRSTASRLSTRR